MIKPDCHITIGRYTFSYSVGVDIVTSVDSLTDTCTITIPRKLQWQGRQVALGDDPILARGDRVMVQLGYDGLLSTEFVGFVRDIETGTPVKLHCDDSMYLLKKGSLTLSYSKVSLRKLLTDIMPAGIEWAVPEGNKEINLGGFRITKASPAKILEELKSTYGLYSYFRLITTSGVTRPVLYAGLAYWTDRQTVLFKMGDPDRPDIGDVNVINFDGLQYRKSEDLKLKVKAISMRSDNSKTEVEVGDDDGEQRTVYMYNATKAELQVFADQQLEKLKYTGYRGSFTAFGKPAVQKSDVVSITGNKYNPSGDYLVKGVTKKFGTSGYRQTIEIELAV